MILVIGPHCVSSVCACRRIPFFSTRSEFVAYMTAFQRRDGMAASADEVLGPTAAREFFSIMFAKFPHGATRGLMRRAAFLASLPPATPRPQLARSSSKTSMKAAADGSSGKHATLDAANRRQPTSKSDHDAPPPHQVSNPPRAEARTASDARRARTAVLRPSDHGAPPGTSGSSELVGKVDHMLLEVGLEEETGSRRRYEPGGG